MDTWILQMVRRSLMRRLVACGAAAALVLYLTYLSRDYLIGFVEGPLAVSAGDLDRMVDPDGSPQFYVRVRGSQTVETGIQEFTVRTENDREVSRRVSSVFYALALGDKYLIVKSPGGIQNPVEGSLTEMPDEFDRNFFDSKEMKSRRNEFYSFMLDAAPYRTGGYWAILGMLVFLLLLLWKVVPAWRWLRDPERHPVMARVLTWGDPIAISTVLERELGGPEILRAAGWTLTDSYLVRRAVFAFDVLRFRDLVWAYKKVTKHRINFIPTGKTYAAQLICYGGSAEVTGSEARVDEYLRLASRRAPWAVFGFTDELARIFKADRSGFCAAVEERRQQMGAT